MKNLFAILAVCGLSLSAHAGCYSIYSPASTLIFQSSEAPVDTRFEYHGTVPQRFGKGATLVYVNDEQNCPEIGALIGVSAASTDGAAGIGGTARATQGRPSRADRG